MCVLYDMGYTLPDYQTAYLNAMDLVSAALDKCVYDYHMNDFSWEELSLVESSSSSTMQQSIDTPIAPKVCHMNATITCNKPGTLDQSLDQGQPTDGHIEDLTPDNIFTNFREETVLAHIKIRNMLYCKGDPIEIPSQTKIRPHDVEQRAKKV
jgi:hypothetical protein